MAGPMTLLPRRSVIWGGAAAAVSTVAPPRVPAASPEWDQIVAAARKEGKVAVNTFTGTGYARIFKLFTQAYPEIKLDHTNLEPVDFSPRVVANARPVSTPGT